MENILVNMVIYYDNGTFYHVSKVNGWSIDDDRNIHYTRENGEEYHSKFGDVSAVVTRLNDEGVVYTSISNYNSNNVYSLIGLGRV
jgi:hypothetical protein